MAGEHIDEAFVDIKPDVEDFSRDLNRELTSSLKSIERKLDDTVDDIDRQFKNLVDDLEVHFHHLTARIDEAFDDVKKDALGAGRAIATDIEAGTKVAKNAIDDLADNADRDFARMKRNARGSGMDVGRSFFTGFFSAIKDIGSSIGSSLGNIGSSLGGFFGGGGDIASALKVTAIAAAIPVVIALAGALSQLLGLLALIPAGFGVIVASIAPLIIAFQGFGEAISAGFAGDVEKLNEALKNLAPSARAVVKEFIAFKEPLKQIRKDVQQAFFGELVGQIKPLLQNIIPVLGRGLVAVAGSLSRFAAGFTELLRSPMILGVIRDLFLSTARIIDSFAPATLYFIETLFKLMQAGLPWIEKFADSFAIGLVHFSDFLANAVNSGQFTKWIEDAVRVAGQLWDLLKAVGGLLKTLFVGTAASGEDFIVKLTQMINGLNHFFSNTKEGKETLIVLAATVKLVAAAVLGFGIALANILRWGNQFVHWLIDAWEWIKSVGSAIGDFFGSVGSAITGAWNTLTGWISGAWNAVVGFFTALPGRIGAAISALPGILRNAAVAAFDQLFYAIGFGIGTVIAFFRDLPARVGEHISVLWATAKALFRTGIDAVVSFFSELPGRVSRIVESAKLAVILKATELKNGFVARIRELVETATSTVRSLPGRLVDAVRDAVSRFFSLGRDIVQGMINGIGSMVSSLVNAAKRAASKAWEGAKDALGIGSPSKEFAKLGRWSMEGFNKGFDDEGDDSRRRGDGPSGFMPADVFGVRGPQDMKVSGNHGGGGTTVVAYLQISDGQLTPVVVKAIEENPQSVARANERGDTQLSRRR